MDAPETMRDVFDWLDVDISDAVVSACAGDTAFEKLTKGRAPGQVDETSFLRKGTAGQWKEDMTAEQREVFWSAAGDTMIAMGYDREGRVKP